MNLNSKEQEMYITIQKIVNGEITRKEGMEKLKLSRQQIYRLIKKYHSEGEKGFVHGNRGKSNPNKKDENLIKELEELYLKEYYDYNFEHFYEEINKKYNISYDVILKRFTQDDIISPLAHKKTVKKYNEKMKKAITNKDYVQEEKIELFKSRIIEIEKAHIRRSNNLYVFGQEIQMDACEKNGLVE